MNLPLQGRTPVPPVADLSRGTFGQPPQAGAGQVLGPQDLLRVARERGALGQQTTSPGTYTGPENAPPAAQAAPGATQSPEEVSAIRAFKTAQQRVNALRGGGGDPAALRAAQRERDRAFLAVQRIQDGLPPEAAAGVATQPGAAAPDIVPPQAQGDAGLDEGGFMGKLRASIQEAQQTGSPSRVGGMTADEIQADPRFNSRAPKDRAWQQAALEHLGRLHEAEQAAATNAGVRADRLANPDVPQAQHGEEFLQARNAAGGLRTPIPEARAAAEAEAVAAEAAAPPAKKARAPRGARAAAQAEKTTGLEGGVQCPPQEACTASTTTPPWSTRWPTGTAGTMARTQRRWSSARSTT